MTKEELAKALVGNDMPTEALRETLNQMAIDMGIMYAQMEASKSTCIDADNVASYLYLLKRIIGALG